MTIPLELLVRAYEEGEAEAQFELGILCFQNNDIQQAFKWLMEAAQQDHAEAQCALGNMYANVFEDHVTAIVWHLKSAEQGCAEAQYYIGWRYATGTDVPKDGEKARQWLLKAADQQYDGAQDMLAALDMSDLTPLSSAPLSPSSPFPMSPQ